jgi:hypothetical protein
VGSQIGIWLSYVGSCLSSAEPTCRPFLAFVALLAAAFGALTLTWLAYRALARRTAEEPGHAIKTAMPRSLVKARIQTALEPSREVSGRWVDPRGVAGA